jgi:hypothetical protein
VNSDTGAESTATAPKRWNRLTRPALAIATVGWLANFGLLAFRFMPTESMDRTLLSLIPLTLAVLIAMTLCCVLAIVVGFAFGRSRRAYVWTFLALTGIAVLAQAALLLTAEGAEPAPPASTAQSEAAEEATRQVGAAMIERVGLAASAKREAAAALNANSPFDLSHIAERTDLEDIRERAASFREASRDYLRALGFPIETVRQEFANRGINDEAVVKSLVDSAREHRNYPTHRKVQALDDEYGALIIEAMDLLEAHWGQWSIDEADASATMHNEELHDEWLRIVARVDEIKVEQQALTRPGAP